MNKILKNTADIEKIQRLTSQMLETAQFCLSNKVESFFSRNEQTESGLRNQPIACDEISRSERVNTERVLCTGQYVDQEAIKWIGCSTTRELDVAEKHPTITHPVHEKHSFDIYTTGNELPLGHDGKINPLADIKIRIKRQFSNKSNKNDYFFTEHGKGEISLQNGVVLIGDTYWQVNPKTGEYQPEYSTLNDQSSSAGIVRNVEMLSKIMDFTAQKTIVRALEVSYERKAADAPEVIIQPLLRRFVGSLNSLAEQKQAQEKK